MSIEDSLQRIADSLEILANTKLPTVTVSEVVNETVEAPKPKAKKGKKPAAPKAPKAQEDVPPPPPQDVPAAPKADNSFTSGAWNERDVTPNSPDVEITPPDTPPLPPVIEPEMTVEELNNALAELVRSNFGGDPAKIFSLFKDEYGINSINDLDTELYNEFLEKAKQL